MNVHPTGAGFLIFGALLFFLTGCENVFFDVESVQLGSGFDVGEDIGGGDLGIPDSGSDMDEPGDADVPGDMDADVRIPPDLGGDMPGDLGMDIGVDMGMDMGPVSACPGEFPLDPNACNPVTRMDCPQGAICNVVFDPNQMRLFLACSNPSMGSGGNGDPCTGTSSCQPEFSCVNWGLQGPDPRGRTCSKFCELETGQGCSDDEFCTKALEDLSGIGFCAPRCDPYDSTSCGTDSTCSRDFNFPDFTCEAAFRCLRTSAGGGGKLEGEICDESEASTNCVSGLVCYDTGGQNVCVEPCQQDSDCSGGTCGDPAGSWDLRYCE